MRSPRSRRATARGYASFTPPQWYGTPEMVGTPTVGATVSMVPTSASGSGPLEYTYAWLLDGVEIPGATGLTYNVVASDEGKVLQPRQRAHGPIPANSAQFRADGAGAVVVAAALDLPGQVTGLTVGTVTTTSVSLSWAAPATGGSPSNYKWQYKQTSSGTWLDFAHATSTALSCSITGLTAGTSYDFRIIATNATGDGTPSATVTQATTASGGTLPGTVGGLNAAALSSYIIHLKWTAATGTPTNYRLEYRQVGSPTWITYGPTWQCRGTYQFFYVDDAPSTAFEYRVWAINANGESASPSAVATATTLARLAFTDGPVVSSYGALPDDGASQDPATAPAWNLFEICTVGTVRTHGGNRYWASATSQGVAPPNASYWRPIAATTYYVNADTGNDANNGTSRATAWRTLTKLSEKITQSRVVGGAAANNTVCCLERGTTATYDGVLYIQLTGGPNLMFGTSGSGAKPIIKWDTRESWQTRPGIVVFLSGATQMRSIDVRMGTAAATGINALQNYVAEGGVALYGCEIGPCQSAGIRGDDCFGVYIENCTFNECGSAGIFGLHQVRYEIYQTTFNACGSSASHDHQIYMSGPHRTVIRGCRFYDGGGNFGLMIHGATSEVIIDQNEFDGNHNGISVDNGYTQLSSESFAIPSKEVFASVRITRNVIKNCGYGTVQGQGYGLFMNAWRHGIVSNNVFMHNRFGDLNLNNSGDVYDYTTADVDICHNSIVNDASQSIFLSNAMTGVRLRNNAIHLLTADASAIVAAPGVTASETDLSSNRYYAAAGTTRLIQWLGTNYATLAAFQAATGKETGSSEGSPGFTNTTGDFALTGGSACKNAGTPITSANAVAAVTVDQLGASRSLSAPSIGARE